MFTASVKENVKYGKPEATDAEVQAAIKAANATDFVSALAEGLNTKLGDLGVRLSGG